MVHCAAICHVPASAGPQDPAAGGGRSIIGAFMQRRELLRQLSRAAALLAWHRWSAAQVGAQGQAAAPWRAPAEVFTLGVASGEPRHDSVVLWTRLVPRPMQPDGGMPARPVLVRWEVARDSGFRDVVASGERLAVPDSAHSVHVLVNGLTAGREYHYRFEAGGARSPVGRTRTAPDPASHPRRLRAALASCQHYEQGHFTVHRDIARADVDVVLFAGDYIYTSRQPGYARVRTLSQHMPDRRALSDYRVHHASYKLDPDLRAAHAAHPWLLVWDDHDVISDYAGNWAPDIDDAEAFTAIRAAAYQAWFEHLPVSPHRAPVDGALPLYDRFAWGRLADLWLLDTRQFRDTPPCQDTFSPFGRKLLWRCDAAQDEARSPMGLPQEYWLAEGLAGSAAAWKLVLQTTQLSPSPMPGPWGELLYADGWDAFPAARRRLMEAIAQPRVQDVVFLGGDVHRHVAANLRHDPLDPGSPIVASEFVTSSVTSRGLSEWATSHIRRHQPDLLHCRSDQRGYALLDLTPERLLCEFRATPHPVRADARFHVQARYEVLRGRPGPVKA